MQYFPNAKRSQWKREKDGGNFFERFDKGSAARDGRCNDNRDAAGQDSASLQCRNIPSTQVGEMNNDEVRS